MAKLAPPPAAPGDPLLGPLLGAPDAESRDMLVAALLQDHAETVIRKNLRFRLSSSSAEDLEDLHGTIVVRLLRKLEEIERGEAEPIASFADYVAIITHHAADDFLRRKFPERALFKNRLRYLLAHDTRFAVWHKRRRLFCGLAAWAGADATPLHHPPAALLDPKRLADSLLRLFAEVGAPLEVDALVSLFAIDESRPSTVEAREMGPSILERLSTRESLTTLWSEIELLPPRQRTALLLHFRDEQGQSALPLLVLTGTATMAHLAEMLSMTTMALAAVWSELPFDDNRIAGLLEATRQQIINLRKCARERLARRTRR